MSDAAINERIAAIYRDESGRVLATLVRLLGDFDRAEEALQEAFSAALASWPSEGIPASPGAWLVSTGRFKAIDALRRERRGRELVDEAVADVAPAPSSAPDPGPDTIEDDRLRLLMTCCHPDLPVDARVALALRQVCGLSTEQIARAYLVSPATMKRRISRAKALIRDRQIPYEIPAPAELSSRLDAVLQVIYLVYNEGYAATSGEEHRRADLAQEATFLARLVVDLAPEPEAAGLLALLLLHESRRATRTDEHGDPVALEDQDRSRWDRGMIDEGLGHLWRVFLSGRLGAFSLQAAIVSVHATAPSVEETNWALIVGYYDLLLDLKTSRVVELQRAIAIGMRDGPAAGLVLLDALAAGGDLSSCHSLHAARADLLRRQGQRESAAAAYRQALSLVRQTPERRWLERQLGSLAISSS